LYPTACKRYVEEQGGITSGQAFVIEKHQRNIEFLSQPEIQNYTVKIRVTGMTKQQSSQIGVLPERCKKTGKVKFHWRWEGKEFVTYCGRITLEDSIRLLGLQFEILDGVYWKRPETPNMKYAELIQLLYDIRVKFKKSQPALALFLKLCLNVGTYGALCRKPVYNRTAIKPKSKSLQYLANNFDEIQRFRDLSTTSVLFELVSEDLNYTSVKIATDVLEMSKRCMNLVFEAASQIGITIPYSDTDSFVVDYKRRTELIERYEANNGLVYTGTDLGNFHSDFSIKTHKHINEENIVSTEFWNLGKKQYIHMIEAICPKTGQLVKSYKMSCKGFPEKALIFYAKNRFGINDTREALRLLFKSTAEGNEHEINLFPTRETRIGYNTNMVAYSVSNIYNPFTRIFKKNMN
jgi:hypothetical protein